MWIHKRDCFSAQKDNLESLFVFFLLTFFSSSCCYQLVKTLLGWKRNLRTYVNRGKGDNNLTGFLRRESFNFQQNSTLQFKQFSSLSSFLLWYHSQSLKRVHFNGYSRRETVEWQTCKSPGSHWRSVATQGIWSLPGSFSMWIASVFL